MDRCTCWWWQRDRWTESASNFVGQGQAQKVRVHVGTKILKWKPATVVGLAELAGDAEWRRLCHNTKAITPTMTMAASPAIVL